MVPAGRAHPGEPLDGRDRARVGVRARDTPARVRAGQPDGLVTVADLDRADVLRFIDAAAPDSPMVLGLGGIAREMLAVAGRKGHHFISLDAMGQTVPVALGLALGLEHRAGVGKVIAIEGDGSLLMGLSVLSTVGHLKPDRLVVYGPHKCVYLATAAPPPPPARLHPGRV